MANLLYSSSDISMFILILTTYAELSYNNSGNVIRLHVCNTVYAASCFGGFTVLYLGVGAFVCVNLAFLCTCSLSGGTVVLVLVIVFVFKLISMHLNAEYHFPCFYSYCVCYAFLIILSVLGAEPIPFHDCQLMQHTSTLCSSGFHG